jgi:D-sedoheptulose 7-phosphate isomerase
MGNGPSDPGNTFGTEGWVAERIETSIAVKRALVEQAATCAEVGTHLVEAYRRRNSSFWFGNGGSAADAQHLAGEFVGRFYLERGALPAVALTVNTSILTAIGNDYGFDRIFARQLEALGRPGDVAIGLSTSGNSRNVVEGLRTAKQLGLLTVALTGRSGGRLKDEADFCLCVPSDDTPRIQESHILIGHIWAELVEHALADRCHD